MTGRQKKIGIALVVAAVLAAVAVWRIEAAAARALSARYTPPDHPIALPAAEGDAQLGERLAHVDGCFACHGAALTGKLAYAGPLGTRLVAPNLTALGSKLSDVQLAAAIRYGIKPDGTSVFGMPADMLVRSSDSDIASIIAYLHTLQPKPDAAPKTQWGLVGKAMVAMDFLPAEATQVDPGARGPVTTPTDPVARGHYIARAHCAACHGDDLSGNTLVASPDLRFAIIHYTPAAFMHFFATGQGQIGHGTKTMTPMIERRFRYLSKADVRAIYAYLTRTKEP